MHLHALQCMPQRRHLSHCATHPPPSPRHHPFPSTPPPLSMPVASMAVRHHDVAQAFSLIDTVCGGLVRVLLPLSNGRFRIARFAPPPQQAEVAHLRGQVGGLSSQLEQARKHHVATVEALKAENESLLKHNEMLQGEVSRLRRVESDRLVRTALDRAVDAVGSSTPGSRRSSGTAAEEARGTPAGRPPRAPVAAHPTPPTGGGLDTLDASLVGLEDSLASSKSLLRALQGGGAAEAAGDGELEALMHALTAASAPLAATTPSPGPPPGPSPSGPGRSAAGDHVLNSSTTIASQLQRVSAAQERLLSRAGAAEEPASPEPRGGLPDPWWAALAAAVPGDRVELLGNYLAAHQEGRLSRDSLLTRARVLLVDSVTVGAVTASGAPVASHAVRQRLVGSLAAALA